MTEHDETQKRWTAKRRSALVLEVLRGDVSVVEAARKHGLTVAEIEDWRDRFLSGAETALRSRPLDEEAQKEQELKRLKQKVGELVMELDVVREAIKGHPSLRQMRDA
ncbi:MAG: transposase [Chloroflexota bacterium]|nr:transposase [Chloroflexota bacterium]